MPPCVRTKRGSSSSDASSVPTKTRPPAMVGFPWTAVPSVTIHRTLLVGARALNDSGRFVSVETLFRPGSHPPHCGQSVAPSCAATLLLMIAIAPAIRHRLAFACINLIQRGGRFVRISAKTIANRLGWESTHSRDARFLRATPCAAAQVAYVVASACTHR